MIRFDVSKLKIEMESAFKEAGLNAQSRRHAIESLIQTSTRGVDSHGINLFPHYVNAVKKGRINKEPENKFKETSHTTLIMDADHAIGHYSGYLAMTEAVARAKQYGMCSVAVKNSTHFGAAAYFGLTAANHDCIGFAFTNADALVKAANAVDSIFGTNPICFTAPLKDEEPLCLDMATSLVSWNKVRNCVRTDTEVPLNWGYDKQGSPTNNPSKIISLAPIGGYKGYGLGMMIDILCAVLTNSPASKDIKPMFSTPLEDKRYIGHYFMAIDINKFLPVMEFKQRLQDLVNSIRNMTPIDSNEPVMVPGDPEKKIKEQRLLEGIPVDDIVFNEFCRISCKFKDCIN